MFLDDEKDCQTFSQNRVKISGKITDTADNSGMSYVTVSLANTRYGTTTDEKGMYTLYASAGEYTLSASMIDYDTVIKPDAIVSKLTEAGEDPSTIITTNTETGLYNAISSTIYPNQVSD